MVKSPFQQAADVVKFYSENEDGGKMAKEFLEEFKYVLKANEGDSVPRGDEPPANRNILWSTLLSKKFEFSAEGILKPLFIIFASGEFFLIH